VCSSDLDGKAHRVHVGEESGAWPPKFDDEAVLESFSVDEFRFGFPRVPVGLDVVDEEVPHRAFMPGGPVNGAEGLEQV